MTVAYVNRGLVDDIVNANGDDVGLRGGTEAFDGACMLLKVVTHAGGVLPAEFAYKSFHKRAHGLRQPYRPQNTFPGLLGNEEHPDVVDLPPLRWHFDVNCAYLKASESACHSMLRFGGLAPGDGYVIGPDGDAYVPVWFQTLKADGRKQRQNTANEFYPIGPFHPVADLSACNNHPAGVVAGKQRRVERAQHADKMKNTQWQGPASYRNAHTAALSPDKVGRADAPGRFSKNQSRNIQHKKNTAAMGITTGLDAEVLGEYASMSSLSEKQVAEAFPPPELPPRVPAVKNRLFGKVHDVITVGDRVGFTILSFTMLLAMAAAVYLGGGGCHIDFTSNVMPTVFGHTMNALVFASPFPAFVGRAKINPAIAFIALTNRQTQYDIYKAFLFFGQKWRETFGVALPFKYYQSDCALEILSAVMQYVNHMKPMTYNMMAEFLLWRSISVTRVLAIVGPPLFWDHYHSTSAVYRWVRKHQWPAGQAEYMQRWVVVMFRAMRDCMSLHYLYSMVAVFITMLKLEKLPWKGSFHSLAMDESVPVRIRGRLVPDNTPEFQEIVMSDAELSNESTINAIRSDAMVAPLLSSDGAVASAAAECDNIAQGGVSSTMGDPEKETGMEEAALESWVQEGSDLPDAEARVNKRMQHTTTGSGFLKRVKIGDGEVSFVVNNGHFTAECKVWAVDGCSAVYTSGDEEVKQPCVVVARQLRDQSRAPTGKEAWHFVTYPIGVGVVRYIDLNCDEIDNHLFQGVDCDAVSYFNTQWLPYLIQFSSVLRSAAAGVPNSFTAAAVIEVANRRLKHEANEGNTVLNAWTVLNRWCGLVRSTTRNTANAFVDAFNAVAMGVDKAANGKTLMGWLDVENRASINDALVAYGGGDGTVEEGEDARVDGDEGMLTEGHWNRVGLSKEEITGFCEPTRNGLKALQTLLVGKERTWVGQIQAGGHFRDMWTSLFKDKKIHISLVANKAMDGWTQVNTKRRPLQVPLPNNKCALQYFAIMSFFEMVTLEPEMLRLPEPERLKFVARCRERMGALMHTHGATIDTLSGMVEPTTLNLPEARPLPLNPRAVAAPNANGAELAGLGSEGAPGSEDGVPEDQLATQEADAGVEMPRSTGVTPNLHDLSLQLQRMDAEAGPPNGVSPKKRGYGGIDFGSGRGAKQGGSGRGRGRRGRPPLPRNK